MSERIFIIAEVGVNHNGDLDTACRLVDAAADAGVDAVKFQTYSADRIVTKWAPKAGYQHSDAEREESHYEMLKRLELSEDAHDKIISRCRERGIAFLSSPFDVQDCEFLTALGVPIMKIPSGEITNLPYLRKVGESGKPIIMSTGMATMEEIESALTVLETAGTPRASVTVLHCTTEYPAPMDEVNLKAMRTIGDVCRVKVGYSDHTPGIEISVAAAALGAVVIEKHFTLDRDMDGPDHCASLVPEELGALVRAIRNIEVAMGTGVKVPQTSELKNAAVARKSIVATRDIPEGERFTEVNIAVMRPGGGINPMRWDDLLGRTAKRRFAAGELIEL